MTDVAKDVNSAAAEELSKPMTIGVEAYISEEYARLGRLNGKTVSLRQPLRRHGRVLAVRLFPFDRWFFDIAPTREQRPSVLEGVCVERVSQ